MSHEKDLISEQFQSDPVKLASLIAHQLQGPLNAVNAALQAVLGEYTGPLLPQQRGPLEKAGERCDEAIRSVRRMLAIIRATAEDGPESAPAALENVVRQVYMHYVDEAARQAIAFDLSTDIVGVAVRIHEPAFVEMVSALVSNALKYTPEHGRVQLATAPGETPDRVRVIVTDSGPGVPENERERIFTLFYRSAAARESGRPGVGLGLAFVKSAAVSAGGRVWVQSAPQGGAEFVLELPVAERLSAPGAERPAVAPSLRVVVIGGVTAGPKAAARIIRLKPDADVTVVDRGSILSYAGCGLPYYVAGTVRDQKDLISSSAGIVRDPVFFRKVMNVHLHNRTEVFEIDRAGKRVHARDVGSGRTFWLPYDRLLLTAGAKAVVPPALRTNLKHVFTLHGVRDAEGIRAALAGNYARDVVIVGGGLIGIEMTEALVSKGARVTILEQAPQILPILDPDMAVLVERHLEAHGVRIVTGADVRGFEGEGTVSGVVSSRGTFPADLVILACGIVPEVALARQAGLELGETGAIKVDAGMRTSDPDILAAGDCTETVHLLTGAPFYYPMGTTAAKQGRVAAANLCGGTETFPGVLGSSICKVFDFTAARTGLGEGEARARGLDVETVIVPGLDRTHFMPAARLLLLKLIVDRTTRRLLGVQATGPGAADKRIDVAATAITAGLTVDQVANLDLAYAPPYATAMDSLITACNVARNKLSGALRGIRADELHRLMQARADFLLLDVRTPQEQDQGHLRGSQLIPLGALRAKTPELPKDKLVVTYCDIGLRGYEAALMLTAAGCADVRTLEGGLAVWPHELIS